MPRATLTVTLPDATWIGAVSRAHPEATFRVLAVMGVEETGVGLLAVEAPDIDAVVRSIEASDGIVDLDPVGVGDGEAFLRFETTEPLLLIAAREAGIPLSPPVPIRDGQAQVEVTAPHERLSTLVDRLDALGLAYDLHSVKQSFDSANLLTEGQREILERAVELGYYATPRTCTLTDLADDLGVAKSTASERLHRAESAVIRAFVDEALDPAERVA